jgi:hypothetical protein
MKSILTNINSNRFVQSWFMIAITMLAFILLCLSLNSFAKTDDISRNLKGFYQCIDKQIDPFGE